ncbi:thiamine phosphate synthase [Levilactobacillus namurensis]|uniref:thiamine phosphate synthase n=1 Tax=Levilactobacillus namurensis TaxID=380393 RepID=UPI0004659A12|nr:thiamine phosphate synthase [Levilactobacillus namurensis]
MHVGKRPLYLVTDRLGIEEEAFLCRLELACQGGVDLVQLREKSLDSRHYFQLAQQVKAITDQYELSLIIDDRLDIALAVNAAGVHLGQQDIPVDVARRLLGPRKIIGATTKTVRQAQLAVRAGADYLGVGAIFPTTTHVKTVHTSVATLAAIQAAVPIPVYAIGGLNSTNVTAVQPAKVAGVAVVSAIMKAPHPDLAAQALRQKVLTVVR